MADVAVFTLALLTGMALLYVLKPGALQEIWQQFQDRTSGVKNVYRRVSSEGVLVNYQGETSRIVEVRGEGLKCEAVLQNGRVLKPFLFQMREYCTVKIPDWRQLFLKPSEAVLFFDDTQDALKRVDAVYAGDEQVSGDYSSKDDVEQVVSQRYQEISDQLLKVVLGSRGKGGKDG